MKTPETFKQLRKFNSIKHTVLSFLKKLNENGITTEKAYFFGSFANGSENRFSDIDIAIVSPELSNDRFKERIRLMKIACDIDSRLEPVPFNSKTFIEEDPLAWEIIKTGTLIKSL